ncbi:MAG TPA: helix-turn-helix domain-containing protein [Aquaticitalea sp.]|nr:helix-turn-helix domain-containing protein [Aquaticitalea sp.]
MADLTNLPQFQDEEWMMTPEALKFLRVSPKTLQRWIKNNEIPVCIIGRTNYFPKKYIMQMMYLKIKGRQNPPSNPSGTKEQPPS